MAFFSKKSKKAGEKFRKTYKGALSHAKKEKGLSADKAEEYAMRTALDKMPKSYFKEPGPEHGPGKSGPLTAKRSADGRAVRTAQDPQSSAYFTESTQPMPAPAPEAAPRGDKPSWWDSLPEAVKNYVRQFIGGNAPQGEVEVGAPKITRQKPAKRAPRRSPLVSKVQALLLQAGLPVGSRSGKPDGLFGPTTAKSWNALMDRAQISPESAPRVSPKRPKAPSPAVMQYVTRFGKEILSRARPAAKPAAKPAPKPAAKPAAKPAPKPPQVWDEERAPAEMPSGLTPRQQELWRRSRGRVEEPYGGA